MIYTKIEKKDIDRVQKLIDKDDDGSRMSKSIKDMNKAIRRYVASRILMGEGPISIEDFKNNNYGKFSSFCNRAVELGATYLNIIVHFIKEEDIPIVIDWIIDEYLNEEQFNDYMSHIKYDYEPEKKLDILINNFINDKDRLACDIYKIFL